MALSERAQSYLATFNRRQPVPVGLVADALARSGCPRLDRWLDFHSRFAGYEELIGRDLAVWGIVHAEPTWLDPDEATVELRDGEWRVICADVHPSYDYWLDSRGHFVGLGNGGPYEAFDVKVERDAVMWEASAHGHAWSIAFDLMRLHQPSIGCASQFRAFTRLQRRPTRIQSSGYQQTSWSWTGHPR